jgi:hypothetical protein
MVSHASFVGRGQRNARNGMNLSSWDSKLRHSFSQLNSLKSDNCVASGEMYLFNGPRWKGSDNRKEMSVGYVSPFGDVLWNGFGNKEEENCTDSHGTLTPHTKMAAKESSARDHNRAGRGYGSLLFAPVPSQQKDADKTTVEEETDRPINQNVMPWAMSVLDSLPSLQESDEAETEDTNAAFSDIFGNDDEDVGMEDSSYVVTEQRTNLEPGKPMDSLDSDSEHEVVGFVEIVTEPRSNLEPKEPRMDTLNSDVTMKTRIEAFRDKTNHTSDVKDISKRAGTIVKQWRKQSNKLEIRGSKGSSTSEEETPGKTAGTKKRKGSGGAKKRRSSGTRRTAVDENCDPTTQEDPPPASEKDPAAGGGKKQKSSGTNQKTAGTKKRKCSGGAKKRKSSGTKRTTVDENCDPTTQEDPPPAPSEKNPASTGESGCCTCGSVPTDFKELGKAYFKHYMSWLQESACIKCGKNMKQVLGNEIRYCPKTVLEDGPSCNGIFCLGCFTETVSSKGRRKRGRGDFASMLR